MHIMTESQNEILSYVKYTFLTSGIEAIDHKKALLTNDFVVLAGGTGSGKSTVALYMACSIAKSGDTVVFLNAENEPKLMRDKIEALGFNYDSDFGKFESNGQNRLVILSAKSISFNQIMPIILSYKPKALFLDLFSTLLDEVESNMIPKITRYYAKELSFYPEKYNCAIIVTEQLMKDNRRIGRPTINDIQGGSGLCQKATKIFTIYRYCKENLERMMKELKGGPILMNTTELIIRKDRFGLLNDGFNFIKFDKNLGFSSLDDDEVGEYHKLVFNPKGV